MCPNEQSSISRCLKNKGDFHFALSKENGLKTTDACTFASSSNEIQIFLNGMIYDTSEEQLIGGFLSQGVDYINQVEGSFVIFLIEGTQFHIITDKVNSKKAFYAFIDSVWYVSNNIDALPKQKCQISLPGLACYLANGIMLNDLTLFQEIKSAKRACIHSFKNSEISIRNYWSYRFEYSASTITQQEDYQKELESLLIRSIKRRYTPTSNMAISMSGGYDSRSILGILHKNLEASNITCFSYSLTENPKMGSDGDVAKEIAAKCGYPHQTFKSYKGDLIEHLKANVREGKCVSDFCTELETWHSLAEDNQFSDIFVGEHSFGGHFVDVKSKEEILDSLHIWGASGIRWVGNFISKKIYKEMCQSLNKLTDYIFESTNAISDPFDKWSYLYLDQRLNHAHMPWRENFASQAGFVHNPFLDGDILDFTMKLPPYMRKHRLLYWNTIRKMLPDLFSIRRASVKDVRPDWQEELHKHKDLLISLIQGTESRLDGIISKKELIAALEQKISIFMKAKAFSMKVLDHIRIRNKSADELVSIFTGHRVQRPVKPTELLLRLLMIRIYLTSSLSDN